MSSTRSDVAADDSARRSNLGASLAAGLVAGAIVLIGVLMPSAGSSNASPSVAATGGTSITSTTTLATPVTGDADAGS